MNIFWIMKSRFLKVSTMNKARVQPTLILIYSLFLNC